MRYEHDRRAYLPRTLPAGLLRPLRLAPAWLRQRALIDVFNRLFAAARAADELAFLEQRVLRIFVEDAGIQLAFGLQGRRLTTPDGARAADVVIRGSAYDFMLLVSRREDPDTLFFQRRLRLEGNTELGMYLKNFLDAWQPPRLVRVAQRLADIYVTHAERAYQRAGCADQEPISKASNPGRPNQ